MVNRLTKTLHLTLKMTTAQLVETSVTNNSLSKDYSHPDHHQNKFNVVEYVPPVGVNNGHLHTAISNACTDNK